MAHEVDLLLTCGCIRLEKLEAAIYLPSIGDVRMCLKHERAVSIAKVGNPYHIDEHKEKDWDTLAEMGKIAERLQRKKDK